MDARKRIQGILKVFSRAVAGMSEEDCKRLLSGQFEVRISLVERRDVALGEGGHRSVQGEAVHDAMSADESASAEFVPMHKGLTPKSPSRAHGARQLRKAERAHPSMDELHALAARLGELDTRAAAQELLRETPSMAVRENIARLARVLKVYVAKNDNRDAIERKIVEFTVGAKLRADAIYGLNLKRSGSPSDS